MKKIIFTLGVVVGLFLFLGNITSAATILFPTSGGTGTSTAPTYGKVLVGNANGTYTLTATSSLGITSSGGSGTVSTSTNETAGFLPYWTSNSATPALLGKVATGTILGAGGVTVTAAQSVIGSGLTITCSAASGSVTGCLSSTDWTTFNNKQAAGTYVTSLTVASANGFAGSSSGGTTPALTLSTTITGVLKGNGTAISTASNGTDYSLISALTCSAGQFFQQTTAAGVFTCGTPTGSPYPFTPSTDNSINTSATSTPIQGTNPGLGLDVSNTSWYGIGGKLFAYGSTTNQSVILGAEAGGNAATTSNSSSLQTTAIGYQAGKGLTTSSGTGNVAIGAQTLGAFSQVTGGGNVAIGGGALGVITSGAQNMAIGGAMQNMTTGAQNVGIGVGALNSATINVNQNIGIGNNSLGSLNSSGAAGNVGIGYAAGRFITAGSANITIGYAIDPSALTGSAQLNIGNVLYGTNMHNSSTNTAIPQALGTIGIGTTSPFAVLSVFTGNSFTSQAASILFAIGSSTAGTATTTLLQVDSAGHVIMGGSKPSLSSCGTTNSISGTDDVGTIMFTGTLVTACTLTFVQPVATGQTVSCQASSNTTTAFADINATSTTAITFGLSASLSSGSIFYQCSRYVTN